MIGYGAKPLPLADLLLQQVKPWTATVIPNDEMRRTDIHVSLQLGKKTLSLSYKIHWYDIEASRDAQVAIKNTAADIAMMVKKATPHWYIRTHYDIQFTLVDLQMPFATDIRFEWPGRAMYESRPNPRHAIGIMDSSTIVIDCSPGYWQITEQHDMPTPSIFLHPGAEPFRQAIQEKPRSAFDREVFADWLDDQSLESEWTPVLRNDKLPWPVWNQFATYLLSAWGRIDDANKAIKKDGGFVHPYKR